MMDMSYLMSLLGLIILARSFLPRAMKESLARWWAKLIKPVDQAKLMNPFCVFQVPEFESNISNDLYRLVHLHMRAKELIKHADELVLSRQERESAISFGLASKEDERAKEE